MEVLNNRDNFRSNEIENMSNSEHQYETKSENKPQFTNIEVKPNRFSHKIQNIYYYDSKHDN